MAIALAACAPSSDHDLPLLDASSASAAAADGNDAGPRPGSTVRDASRSSAASDGGSRVMPLSDASGAAASDASANGPRPTDAGTTEVRDAALDPSAEIYDPSRFPRFDLELPQSSIDALNMVASAEDPRQDSYVSATLKYGDETVANVGVRLKGEGSFQKLQRKPAFKLKFDEFIAKQSFRGLRRMTLNNAFEDPSFIAERLAYDLFRAAGLAAPRCNSATLYINGTFYGVYVNVEAEDKTFLRRWFEDDGGNLYEEGQKDFVPGAETAFNLETNESSDDRSDLRGLIGAIQAAGSGTFLQDISAQLDTAQFLRFTAAEAAVNQWDMYAYTVFYVNNLRIYSDPKSRKFSFIPWGMDMSMKPFRDSQARYIGLFTLARQGTRANAPPTAGLIFQRCLQSVACKRAYSDAVREIIQVYDALDMEERAARYHAQIRSQVMADSRKSVCCAGGALSNQQFEAGHQSVLTTIRGRLAALRADLLAEAK
jgi:spore coat protein CotH